MTQDKSEVFIIGDASDCEMIMFAYLLFRRTEKKTTKLKNYYFLEFKLVAFSN